MGPSLIVALGSLILVASCAEAPVPTRATRAQAMPLAGGTTPSASATPELLFAENWEDGWSQWDGGEVAGVRERTTLAHAGAYAARLTFQSPNQRGPHGGSAKAFFAPTRELTVRWFMRFAAGFLVGYPETKLLGVFGPQYPTYWLVIFGGGPGGQRLEWGRQITVAAQGIKEVSRPGAPDTRNYHGPFAFTPERWYELEWHIKHNTPGRADGLVELWIDRVKVLDVRRARLVGDGSHDTPPGAGTLDHLDLYRQFGVGQLYFDDLQVFASRPAAVRAPGRSAGRTSPARAWPRTLKGSAAIRPLRTTPG